MAKRLGSTAPPGRQSNRRESIHPVDGMTLAVRLRQLAAESDSWLLSYRESELMGIGLPERPTPIPHGFVGQDDPTFGHEFFDIPVAQANTKIQPHAVD